ncbi:MAG: thioredoxin family protein [Desulfobacteraceae bacterium]|nr:MAG: thioredoxin family protein [Desulfobacteraceae bacterium]
MGSDDIVQIRVGKNNVGIVGLQDAIQELAKESSSAADEKIGQALVDRLKKRNYIPVSAVEAYKLAFLREFKRSLGRLDEEECMQGIAIKILGQGCSRCDGLEREIIDVLAELKLEAEVEHVKDIREIAGTGVVAVPGLIINGQVKSVGSVPPRARLVEWLKQAKSAKCIGHGA